MMFEIMDVNKNGRLEKKEVRVFFEKMTSIHEREPFNEQEFEVSWAAMDINHDGSISEEEMYMYISKRIANG
jgi:Ca2+-binding EF-hand superfamily protein